MIRPTGKQQRPNLQEAIKETALDQITSNGPASLSLRGIARSLDITAPAIYNYYANRNDLVTALIIDAYLSFGEALNQAASQFTTYALRDQFQATARAYRQWGLDHPEEYTLIFGTAFPGYEPPMEQISRSAAGSLLVLINILEKAWESDQLKLDFTLPETSVMLSDWQRKISYNGPATVIHLALSTWSQLHGLVSLELHKQLCIETGSIELDQYFNIEVQSMLDRLGF